MADPALLPRPPRLLLRPRPPRRLPPRHSRDNGKERLLRILNEGERVRCSNEDLRRRLT